MVDERADFHGRCGRIEPAAQDQWVGAKQFVQINDAVKMACVEWGDPKGEPVVLIHGTSDNSRVYSTIAPHMSGKHFMAIDMRGHGDSAKPDCCYYVTDFRRDISDFIRAKQLNNAVVIGHSLGSLTAGVLASVHPEQVKKLVLISFTLAFRKPRSWLYDHVVAASFPLDPKGEFITAWTENPGDFPEEMMTYLRKEEAAVPRQTWLGMVKGMETLDWTIASRHITAPVLILWGDKDETMTEDYQTALRAALPAARFIRYEGLGHSMYWHTRNGLPRI